MQSICPEQPRPSLTQSKQHSQNRAVRQQCSCCVITGHICSASSSPALPVPRPAKSPTLCTNQQNNNVKHPSQQHSANSQHTNHISHCPSLPLTTQSNATLTITANQSSNKRTTPQQQKPQKLGQTAAALGSMKPPACSTFT